MHKSYCSQPSKQQLIEYLLGIKMQFHIFVQCMPRCSWLLQFLNTWSCLTFNVPTVCIFLYQFANCYPFSMALDKKIKQHYLVVAWRYCVFFRFLLPAGGVPGGRRHWIGSHTRVLCSRGSWVSADLFGDLALWWRFSRWWVAPS